MLNSLKNRGCRDIVSVHNPWLVCSIVGTRWRPKLRPTRACRPVCCLERSVRESNPVSVLTTDACCRNSCRPFLPSDPGRNRTCSLLHVTQASSPLDHAIVQGPRWASNPQNRHTLDVTALPVCVLGLKWRVRGSHPAVRAYEAPMSTGPPAACQVAGPGIEPGSSGL